MSDIFLRMNKKDVSLRARHKPCCRIIIIAVWLLAGTTSAETARFAFGVNGLDFSLSRYSISADGQLRHLGHSPLVKSVPYVLMDPLGRFVLVPSKTASHISVFRLNPTNGALAEVAGSPFAAKAISPFELAFHPSGQYLYAAARFSGVGAYRFDTQTGVITPLDGSPFTAGERTRSVSVHPSGHFLYAVNGYSNSLSAYRINATTGALDELPNSPYSAGESGDIDYKLYGMEDVPEGAGGIPYSVAIDPQGQFLFVANWAGASVSVFRVEVKSGHLRAVPGSPFFTGFNPYRVAVHPKGGFIYITQYSGSEIAVHAVDETNGQLNPVPGSPFSTGGRGPVAVNFSADGQQLYVPNYESNDITRFDVNAQNGTLQLREVVKTRSGPWYLALTDGDSVENEKPTEVLLVQGVEGISRLEPASGKMSRVSAAGQVVDRIEQVMLAGGQFVYTLNRAQATLSTYRWDQDTGQLQLVDGGVVATGKQPSELLADVNGWYLYVTNAGDNTLSIYYLNPQTGLPTRAHKRLPIATGKRPVAVTLDAAARYAYVLNADADNVSVYSYLNSVTPLMFDARNAGSPFATGNDPTAIVVEPTGRFAYVANAGSNNLSAYRIHHQTGTLSALPGSPFAADKRPVSLAAHPNGRWLFVANQGSNGIATYRIERELGALKRMGEVSLPAAAPKARQLHLDIAGSVLYLLSSDGLRLLRYSVDAASGQLTLIAEKRFTKPVLDLLIRD